MPVLLPASKQVARLASGLSHYRSLLHNNNMATDFRRFTLC